MAIFNGPASAIEDNRNKVVTIDENSSNEQYPSAKAVYNALNGIDIPVVDQTYAPTSKNAQSGKAVAEAVSDKQDSLVSGTNIKTINNQSILGSGNITIEGGSDVEVDQTYNPESENAQSGKAVAEALQGANSQWKKLADVTITEEVNTITCTHEDMPQCKEFIVRAIFPASTTGETVSLGAAYCYLNNNNIVAFRFPATDINKSVITEQRCHILIADDLIYSIGNDAARGQAAVVANTNTIVGNRVITDNVTQIIYKLNDSTKSYQIGTQFQVYGKVEK